MRMVFQNKIVGTFPNIPQQMHHLTNHKCVHNKDDIYDSLILLQF